MNTGTGLELNGQNAQHFRGVKGAEGAGKL